MTGVVTAEFDSSVCRYIRNSYCNVQAVAEVDEEACDSRFTRLLAILATPPIYTTLRVNTRIQSMQNVQSIIHEHLQGKFKVEQLGSMKDALFIEGTGPCAVSEVDDKVIVDLSCGMAVLRGAHVFAQGIMAAPPYMQPGDQISVYVDVKGKCRKGLTKPFTEGPTYFVGNGTARISRQDLFCSAIPASGIAIEMESGLYRCPSLSEIPRDVVFPQNLPSIVCSHVLDPQPGERVLDMCAAPGGKTTHIATLMNNEGEVVAFDKSLPKVEKIRRNAESWGISIISAYVYDGTKAVDENAENVGKPPYPAETFDKVLLDAPCSALGQRPNICNTDKLKQVQSYPPLQKKLFSQAVSLLRVGGDMVYSTCTVTVEENENIVAWALKTFPCLHLSPQSPHIGGVGLPGCSLSSEQRSMVQRFDPSVCDDYQSSVTTDTIGFFCAKFTKS